MPEEGTEPPSQERSEDTRVQEDSKDNEECVARRLDGQEGACDPRENPLSAKDEAHPVEGSLEEKEQE